MKKLFSVTLGFLVIACILSSCSFAGFKKDGSSQFNEKEVFLDPNAPVISFVPQTKSCDGKSEYYLFDDNPEHLNSRFLADGENPSSIAHFENLREGIYTVFSYHHRGNSVDFDADIFFDTAFSSNSNAEIRILNIGLNHDWDWNQAWADYTGSSVIMPLYLETYNCSCSDGFSQNKQGYGCLNYDCPSFKRGERRDPKTEEYNISDNCINISSEPTFLSDCLPYIESSGLNHFRYGSYNEPMWLMMRFEVVSGTLNFDTLAYQSKSNVKKNFNALKWGEYDYEPQYKGIAENAPIVIAEFDLNIDNNTQAGVIPVTVKNSRVPGGITLKNGTFATNVNTWREKYPIAAESDMMNLVYIDNSKSELYGKSAKNSDYLWRFDPKHSKLYRRECDEKTAELLKEYGIALDDKFEPNSPMSEFKHPTGNEAASDEFYKYTALNLGNFGVTNRYIIHINNNSSENKSFGFEISSIAG